MKPEIKLFAVIGIFFVFAATLYGAWTGWGEPVGWVALYLCAGLGFMISFYLWKTASKLPLRPEDNLDGEIEEQAGNYGAFTPYSWWPLWLGLSASIIFLGVAAGFWIAVFGVVLGVYALIGWVFEHYKGEHAH
ncbi:cytochrome c oxidase subunit 4 [Janibacter sp. YIM B02568]|uniref:cytochrome c oxidase subunit 4 n=1 Tax=Janibacter endophyticus TaxID=2806261 RepID=UPI00194FF1E1|nr:cytochrome c oxidase subunit 4 [Janibacter endophyticus]MBM6546189.1 cytochrome c oxidase subunit 4 [Janibacter endophyticus]